MTRGRKPTPTVLKIVKGNPGKRPLPKDEPKIKRSKPIAPSSLSPEANKHWDKTIEALYEAGIMTSIDTDAMMLYCEAYAKWISANDKIKTHGMVVKSPSGYPVQSPYLSIANKAFDQMKAIIIEFGMTPSSRTRVKADASPVSNEWDD